MERQQCEFMLVRYVPDAVRNEFINIGVLLREYAKPESTKVRFTRDWARVCCIDPEADIDMLEALEAEIQSHLAKPSIDILRILQDSFSNVVQLTEIKGCLAESPIAELEQLMRIYVDAPSRKGVTRRSGRTTLQASMRMQFERAGVWNLMRKKIPAAMYTRPGDRLMIDCAYRPNGVIRMFHAVSLETDQDTAKILAYTAESLREGVARVENAKLELTALVEPISKIRELSESDDRVEQYRFAVEAMEEENIRVLTTTDLPRMAEAARRDFRLM